MKFDILHRLGEDDYFEPMVLSAEKKQSRRELADLLTDVFLYFFAIYDLNNKFDNMLERALYEQLLVDKMSDAVLTVTGIDDYIGKYIRTTAKEVVDTTFKHAKKKQEEQNNNDEDDDLNEFGPQEPLDSPENTSGSHIRELEQEQEDEDEDIDEILKDDDMYDYWLSYKRARSISQNTANGIRNYDDFVEAVESGRIKKIWRTMNDEKVRQEHAELEGKTVGINESFLVGNSYMRFPQDMDGDPNPRDVIGCRCSIEYV